MGTNKEFDESVGSPIFTNIVGPYGMACKDACHEHRWCYLYRLAYRNRESIDFYFSENRDESASQGFLKSAIRLHGYPNCVTNYGIAANKAAIKTISEDRAKLKLASFRIQWNRYQNNLIEQNHRQIKRIFQPMMDFKNSKAPVESCADLSRSTRGRGRTAKWMRYCGTAGKAGGDSEHIRPSYSTGQTGLLTESGHYVGCESGEGNLFR